MPSRRVAVAALGLVLATGASACADKPAAAPKQDIPDLPVVIPPQPNANANANAAVSRQEEPKKPPPSNEDDRARARAEMDRLADDRDRLDRSSRGESTGSKDPTGGVFTMAEATAGLMGSGALVASIKTSKGTIKCRLLDDKAPNTVANFVGLARGVRPWKSPTENKWVKQPIYDGTTFHRIIKGFMIQGGDPNGNGTGEPGYVIKDEIWPGAKHDHAGQLCMANRGPNTNGAQFFITDASVPHLDGNYTIFGECSPASVVHAIAAVPTMQADRPTVPITIDKVEITREGGGGAKPAP